MACDAYHSVAIDNLVWHDENMGDCPATANRTNKGQVEEMEDHSPLNQDKSIRSHPKSMCEEKGAVRGSQNLFLLWMLNVAWDK